jgi:nucleotide-binding universal stress UspA family protein
MLIIHQGMLGTSMYKCIIHATDLQEDHLHYCEQALEISKAFHAELFLLHVLSIPGTWQLAQSLGFAETQPLPTANAEIVMQALGEQLNLHKNHLLIRQGNPRQAIIDTIIELQADLLLIGAPTNPLYQAEMRHLSHYLADHADCDVLLLRAK